MNSTYTRDCRETNWSIIPDRAPLGCKLYDVYMSGLGGGLHITSVSDQSLNLCTKFGGRNIICRPYLNYHTDKQTQIMVGKLGTGVRGLMRGIATLPKVTRSCWWSKTRLEDPQASSGWASPWKMILSLQCFDTVGWATKRASGL